jgi:hypothetical protein
MSNVRLVVKELKDALNTITSFPADWAELTISLTVKSFADDATLTKRMEFHRREDRWEFGETWGP